jgi:hypothetical protein
MEIKKEAVLLIHEGLNIRYIVFILHSLTELTPDNDPIFQDYKRGVL